MVASAFEFRFEVYLLIISISISMQSWSILGFWRFKWDAFF